MKTLPPYSRAAGIGLALAIALSACAPTAANTATAPAVFTQAATPTTALEPTSAPETAVATDPATAAATEAAVTPTTAAEAIATKLNLNTASDEEFLTVPGVGNRMLREFKEYRPYTSILQFRREIGKYVEPAEVAAYEQYVFVPVDINAADADTLKQIPGVDDAIAADLIAARPYADADAFLAALSTHVSPEQLAAAPAYLAAP